MENGELYIPDCLFPTDNPLEIPCLLSDVQPQYIEIPFYPKSVIRKNRFHFVLKHDERCILC